MFCAALPFLIPFLKSPEWGFFILPVFRKALSQQMVDFDEK